MHMSRPIIVAESGWNLDDLWMFSVLIALTHDLIML